MNLGTIHNRRPGKAANQGLGLKMLAKQMGIDPKTFGKEAENMWKMLDDMSESDPQAYREFIDKQLQNGPPPSTPYFTPNPGFVTKAINQAGDTKIFLNCCSHEAIDKPKDTLDRIVPDDARELRSTSGIRIPLAIGESRKICLGESQKCYAVDVVFNPWVLQRCEFDNDFKLEVVKLAVEWVEKEKKLKLQRPSRLIKSIYKGGIRDGNLVKAVPFPITDDDNNATQKGALVLSNERQKESANSVQSKNSNNLKKLDNKNNSLFQVVTQNKDEIQESETPFQLFLSPSTNSQKKLIEEIIPSSTSQKKLNEEIILSPNGSPPVSQYKSSNIVKKGFLNNSKVQLYPNGSSEGLPPSAYVNLLSRSKVVDLSNTNMKKN